MKQGIKRAISISTLGLALTASHAIAQEQISLSAASSLQDAIMDVVSDFDKSAQYAVNTKFSTSKVLYKTIEEGGQADIFVSANMKYPQQLEQQGWGGPALMFARNKLCAIAQPEVKASTENLLEKLLDENIRIGSSSSAVDSSGDYVWELFAKAEIIQSGYFNALSKKALTFTAPVDDQKGAEKLIHSAWVMSEKKADLFLTYCTNAVVAKKSVPSLDVIQIQPELLVGADYGLLVRKDAPESAWKLAKYILSPEGQKTLNSFGLVTIPSEK
jgi:molybdenum ABC transporter molybdate-binding protein